MTTKDCNLTANKPAPFMTLISTAELSATEAHISQHGHGHFHGQPQREASLIFKQREVADIK